MGLTSQKFCLLGTVLAKNIERFPPSEYAFSISFDRWIRKLLDKALAYTEDFFHSKNLPFVVDKQYCDIDYTTLVDKIDASQLMHKVKNEAIFLINEYKDSNRSFLKTLDSKIRIESICKNVETLLEPNRDVNHFIFIVNMVRKVKRSDRCFTND
ncbi:hypothetical protein BpHYR1_016952 [Brachionus plicatilis]|uniref:Uncharacterized protein n=1 Tax=Brachionus plicatilis TaxID=10195 RepID=A0A3M7SRR0_BRAPC|nr:hypothetical protein BpHYR1_016952 [Brachionus plicatilis]